MNIKAMLREWRHGNNITTNNHLPVVPLRGGGKQGLGVDAKAKADRSSTELQGG
jgi:hypothetical protein